MTKEELIDKYEKKKKWNYAYWRKWYHRIFDDEKIYYRSKIEIFSEIISDLKKLKCRDTPEGN